MFSLPAPPAPAPLQLLRGTNRAPIPCRHPHDRPSPPPSGVTRTPNTSRGPPGVKAPSTEKKHIQSKHDIKLASRWATYLSCSLGSLRDLFVSVSDRLVRGRHFGCFPSWCRDVHTRPISNQLMAAVHAATSLLIGWPPGSSSDVTSTSRIFLSHYLQIFTIQITHQKLGKKIINQINMYSHYKYKPFGGQI